MAGNISPSGLKDQVPASSLLLGGQRGGLCSEVGKLQFTGEGQEFCSPSLSDDVLPAKIFKSLLPWARSRISTRLSNADYSAKHYWPLLVAQMIKNLPAMYETRVRSLDQEDPLEKKMATNTSILAWRIPWTEETGGLQPMGS